MKKDCKSPHVWIPGTRSPFTKGHCQIGKATTSPKVGKVASPPRVGILKKSNCKSPNTWIPGTRSPFTKGHCKVGSIKGSGGVKSPKNVRFCKKTECIPPSIWVPGTRKPFKKGYCIVKAGGTGGTSPKAKSPKKWDPVAKAFHKAWNEQEARRHELERARKATSPKTRKSSKAKSPKTKMSPKIKRTVKPKSPKAKSPKAKSPKPKSPKAKSPKAKSPRTKNKTVLHVIKVADVNNIKISDYATPAWKFGDVIGIKNYPGYKTGNSTGKFIWDGIRLVDLDEHHGIPKKFLVGKDFDTATYWENTIGSNNIVYTKFDKKLVQNLVKDNQDDTVTFNYKDNKWFVALGDNTIDDLYNGGSWEYLNIPVKNLYVHVPKDVAREHILIR